MDGREPMHDDELARTIEAAGARPPLDPADLDAIEAAARQAWQAKVAEVKDAELQAHMAELARRSRRWLRVAAVLAFAFAGAVVWWSRDSGPHPAAAVARVEAVDGALWAVGAEGERRLAAGDELPAGSELHSGAGGGEAAGRASLRLAGGTRVRLDAGSRLGLPGEARLALAAGAVYVDTDRGAGGAVAVETPLATVRDVGTRFAVRLSGGAEAAAVEVAVREGEVSVENGETFSLSAGEAARLSADGAVERRAEPAHGAAWEWVLAAAPPYEVDGKSLEEFLAWVEAETGWRVVYAEPALAARSADVVLRGDLAGLRPDQAPFAVLPAANLSAEVSDGVLTVRQRR